MPRGGLLVAHAVRLTKSNLGRFVNRCSPSLARIGVAGQDDPARCTPPKSVGVGERSGAEMLPGQVFLKRDIGEVDDVISLNAMSELLQPAQRRGECGSVAATAKCHKGFLRVERQLGVT